MRRLSLCLLFALAGCVSSGRVKTLEKRIAEMEARETKRELEVNASLLRIEAQLAAMAAGYARFSDLGAEDLIEKLEEIERRIAARPAAPVRPVRPAPDPAKTYAVKIDGAPAKGSSSALVTIVRAGEYACPYCEKSRATMDQIAAHYGSKVRIVHLDFIVHPQTATEAAKAACAAHQQGKFWEMDELLWEQAFKTRQFDAAHIESLATNLGLDMTRFRADLSPCSQDIAQTMSHLQTFGVGATPAFFINGRFLSGAQPFPSFERLIDEELKLAEDRVRKGTKRARYYEEWVVTKGLPRLEPPPPTTP